MCPLISTLISEHSQDTISTETKLTSMTSSRQAFENTSTSVAASQMRNALNKLVDSVDDASEKQVSHNSTKKEKRTKFP